jgi:RpiR family transcriptional regulator, carbohydrate utilization regulator
MEQRSAKAKKSTTRSANDDVVAAPAGRSRMIARPAAADTPAGPSEGMLAGLRAVVPSLTPQVRRAAAYVLGHPAQVLQQSLGEAAEAAGVGEATLVRLCQEAGCRGFQDLKLALARELVQPAAQPHEDVAPGDSVEAATRKVLGSEIAALQDTLSVLDWKAVTRAVDLLADARLIVCCGTRMSAPIAEDAYLRFVRIGLPCAFHHDARTQAILATLSGPGVVMLAVSHSGTTSQTLETVALAKASGAATIVVTGNPRSPIAGHADVVLCTAARETLFRTGPVASRIAAMAIVDALYVSVALRRFGASLMPAPNGAVAGMEGMEIDRILTEELAPLRRGERTAEEVTVQAVNRIRPLINSG